ncbi:hypothetical protein PHYPSEUDO_003313 [Phytophthora pseudosyringae]|uniref:Uncharacterized protein n=1 Tax=Phytophthora pseudosyringae TaxID=221518 RepID=A0A8T1VRJ5_9STRA|nr:hypothetical protein PHYPSEUDO_003313 [Phytophthora pseudosyringae]
MCYGILRDSIFPVAVSQGFGQLAAIVFNVVFFHWSPRKDTLKLYVGALLLHCVATLYFVLSLAGVTGQSNYASSILLGYFGVFPSLMKNFAAVHVLEVRWLKIDWVKL